MNFRQFYKNICLKQRTLNTNNICTRPEDTERNSGWHLEDGVKKIGDYKYHISTIFIIGNKTFPATELTNENRKETYRLFETMALDLMVKNSNLGIDNIVSTTVIDIYAEPVECYPLKVLVEVITNVK